MQGHCWAWEIWPHDKSLLQICVSERSLIPSPFLKSEDKTCWAWCSCTVHAKYSQFIPSHVSYIQDCSNYCFWLNKVWCIKTLVCDVHSLIQHMNLQNAKSNFIYSVWQRSKDRTITHDNVPLVFEVWVDKRVQLRSACFLIMGSQFVCCWPLTSKALCICKSDTVSWWKISFGYTVYTLHMLLDC